MHAAWRLLLDDDFKEGWRNGWVIKCADGVIRRIFPRIFTYSADYPEK
jgi:Plavaka transposase